MDILKRYNCSGCDYSSGHKADMKKHVAKKNKCCDEPCLLDIPEAPCNFCKIVIKTSTKVDYYGKHLKDCQEYKKYLENEHIASIIASNKIEKCNILVNTLMWPDFSHLTTNFKQSIEYSYEKMFEELYFNKKVPKNYCILYREQEKQEDIMWTTYDILNTYKPVAIWRFFCSIERAMNRVFYNLIKLIDNENEKKDIERQFMHKREDFKFRREEYTKQFLDIALSNSIIIEEYIKSNPSIKFETI